MSIHDSSSPEWVPFFKQSAEQRATRPAWLAEQALLRREPSVVMVGVTRAGDLGGLTPLEAHHLSQRGFHLASPTTADREFANRRKGAR
jgi:hypothetical protein